ncbi:MAG: hypothetical protein U5J96_18015 [Ignavibacteriaceae bacterium]|nr:hypothetical protein [Ignavibacteriaceae bacterium]
MKPGLIIFLLIALLVFSGCKSEEQKNEPKQMQGQQYVLPPQQEQPPQTIQKQENIDPKIAAELIAVIRENIAATEAKDKDRVLKTIHKDCPQLRSTIQGMDYVFANFDMKFDLEQIEVLEVSDEDAKIYYMQTTRAISGQGYPPTRASGIHLMKKEDGKWKIFKTEYLTNEQIM